MAELKAYSLSGETNVTIFDNTQSQCHENDIAKLCDLLHDSRCPAWPWFPNNAEMKKLAEYLVDNGVTVQMEG